jgi:small-conductance mechanosensitive channel
MTRGIGVLLVALFILRLLDLFTIRDAIFDGLAAVLSTPLEAGSLSVSLGDILTFVFAIWLSFQVSRFVRFVFHEDVFSRMRLPRGVPYAASAAMHYVIIAIGFFAAILAAGVDMNRFALLGGAVGIGVGFGLQNIVNNFVSGLILLFERPIQVGDRVEIDTVFGEVKRIGIRSSTVRTFDGAEVIVPNSDLIAHKLTNWTLSDRMRRIIIRIGVKYGTDPDEVLALLRGVARDTKDVLEKPEPSALFRAHGESSLDFELRVWTDKFDEGLRIESELTRGVNRALVEAGIEIPFPQRDLHLRSSDVALGGVDEPRDEPSGAADEAQTTS